jgi:hypothetical protein
MTKGLFRVLNALVQIGLIKEYLKNIRRERSVDLSACSADTAKTHLFYLTARQQLIADVLKNVTADPKTLGSLFKE